MNNFIKLYLLSSLSLSFINADTTKFGLGSCLDQDYPQPIWEAIEKEDLDYFVFLGDNVYGDLPSGSLRKMVSAYKKQNNNFILFSGKIGNCVEAANKIEELINNESNK